MIGQDTLRSAGAAVARPRWVRNYRLVFAVLTLAAIVFQYWYSSTNVDTFDPFDFWCFFTIQSNLLAVFVLLWGAAGYPGARSNTTVDLVRGAAVLFMTITFVVYGVLLTGYEASLQTPVPWVNNVLHRVIPIVLMVDWLIEPPRTAIRLRQALLWLLFPLLYAVFTLIRGPIVGWYPYPFLNPERVGGYGVVALYCLGIALASALLAWLVVLVGKHVQLLIKPSPPSPRT